MEMEHSNMGPSKKNELVKPSGGGGEAVRMRDVPLQNRVGMAVFEYKAREQDELSLMRGSMMEIVKEECGEDGWCLARMDDILGMVPKNYVALVGSQPEIVQADSVQLHAQHLLGSGGFADVYRGTYLSQEVALKKPRTVKDGETLKREALILSRLKHENIVHFFGMSLDPLYIVLELCEGGTLFSLGRKMNSSDVMTVIYWAKQVASGIEHMHARDDPLVYADMKAENVLIKERPCECGLADESWKNVTNYHRNGKCRKCDGICINQLTLKLADFNVTRNIGVKRDSFSGSLPWMSPEVIQNRDAHPSADIWSFGMFLWELLSRKIPYNNCEMDVILSTIISKKGPPLPLPSDLPAELRNVFDGCWRRQDRERPSIGEVRAQLEQAELCVDNNYKWMLREEETRREAELERERHRAQLMLEDLCQNPEEFRHQSVNVPLYEGLMFLERFGQKPPSVIRKKWASWFQPPTPAKRQKKPTMAKLDKGSIGKPQDFRHNVSARVSESAGADGSPHDKTLIIRYNEVLNRQLSRSHESLLDCSRDDEDRYSTLPRSFKQNQVHPLDEQQGAKSKRTASSSQHPCKPILDHCSAHHPCLVKLAGKAFGKPKSANAKSNPELNKLSIAAGSTIQQGWMPSVSRGGGSVPRPPPPPLPPSISRRHDYLSLLPPPNQMPNFKWKLDHHHTQQQQRPKAFQQHQKDRVVPELDSTSLSSVEELGHSREYANIDHHQKADVASCRLSRANAIRQRIIDEAMAEPCGATSGGESSSAVTTPSGGTEEQSSSSSGTDLLDGFVVVGSCDGGDPVTVVSSSEGTPTRGNHHLRNEEKGSNLSDLFNRRLSPPPIVSPSADFGNSTFYMPSDDSLSATTEESSGNPAQPNSRRRSTASSCGGDNSAKHRSITAKLLTNLIAAAGSVSKTRNTSTSVASELVVEDDAVSGSVSEAHCCHPHHSFTDAFHLCALRPDRLPEIWLGRAYEFPVPGHRFVKRPNTNAPGRPSKSTHQKFVKLAECPEKQRLRHRTATAAAQRHNETSRRFSGAKSPTTATSSLMMNTVIELPEQQGSSEKAPSPVSSRYLPSPLSSVETRPRGSHGDLSVLKTTIPHQSPTMLSPNSSLTIAQQQWHQRSRSSDSPANTQLSATGLADLLRSQLVPSSGTIVNPSYIPMTEPKSTRQSQTKQSPQQQQQKPVPKPRRVTKTDEAKAPHDNLSEWPKSQAPMLSHAQRSSAIIAGLPQAASTASFFQSPSTSTSEAIVTMPPAPEPQRRPNTLRLLPPVPPPPSKAPVPSSNSSAGSTPATSASLFTSSSNSFGHLAMNSASVAANRAGCDSGMCASSGGATEGESSPPPLPSKNSAMAFGCSSTISPTIVITGHDSCQPIPPPPNYAPPPVPPKQGSTSMSGVRVPPLPKNGQVMQRGGGGQR